MAKLVQLAAAGSYALTSVLILLFNKTILTTYSFKFPFTMALSHMVVGLVLLHALKMARVIKYAAFDITLAKKALPVSLCFIVNVVIGMVALRGTNIPMFATLRRLTVMMVVMCEVIVLRKKQTPLAVVSVTIMVLGSFIGGWGDLQFDLFGYGMVMLNNLVTALNLVFIKKTLSDTKLAADTFGMLYYNSLISIPFLVVLSVLAGEASQLADYPHWSSGAFQLSFLTSAVMSFLMNYSTYWCTEVNSALTTSVTGQVKNVLSSFVALSMFGMKATPMLVAGLSVGLSGSMLYAYAVYRQDGARKAAAAAKAMQDAEAGVQLAEQHAPLIPGHAHTHAHVHGHGHAQSNGTTTVSGGQPVLLTNASVGARALSQDAEGDGERMSRLEAGQRSPAGMVAAQVLPADSRSGYQKAKPV